MYRIDPDAIRTGTEEITQVGNFLDCRIDLGFHNFGSRNGTDVTDGIHIPQSDVRTTKIINKITGRLYITGIFRDRPAVIPDIAAFSGHFIVQFHPDSLRFVHRPDRIAAPGKIEPGFAFRHHFLAEIGFPTGNVGFHLFQKCFGYGDRFGRIVVHQLLDRHGPIFQFLRMGVDNGRTIGVTIAVFHQYLVSELRIPKTLPAFDLFLLHELLVIQNPSRSPHIRDDIVGRFPSRLA